MMHNTESPPARSIVSLRDIHKAFGTLRVLRGVDIDFEEGKTTVILGPSGSGKSVLIKHIVGLLKPDRGEVFFDGQRIDHLPERRLITARMQFGYLFQMSALFDSLTVGANVSFPMVEHSDRSPADQRERCEEVLRLVKMGGTAGKMPAELSGGQRKRIALARAIALGPRVILYDEPTTGLDPIRADTINELILQLQEELKVTSIVITHDMVSAFKIADRMVLLYDGRLVADGTPEEIRNSDQPLVRAFVEGRSDLMELDGLEAGTD